MKEFDLIVIGSGSGLNVASAAAEQGLKTAIIEEGPLGGTCLNRGCIPSKMIIHSADVAETIRQSALFGLNATIRSVNFRKVTRRASQVVDADAHAIERSIRSSKNPLLFKARAKFIGKYTVQAGNEILRGKKIVIAAGARPVIPSIPGLNTVPYLTSTEALRLTSLPQSMIIIGGGYIAAELGNFYGSLGCKITIIQRGPLLISREDTDVAELLTTLWKKKYTLLMNATTRNVVRKGKMVIVSVEQGGNVRSISAEKLLLATGVRPNTDLLDVQKTGVKLNEQGFVVVNKYMETSVKNIWALGDVAGVYLFKHSANLEADYVLQNILSTPTAVDYYPMPHAIFTNPQIAGIGMTEQEVQEKKIAYVVGKYHYKDTGMGAAIEERDGFVKFIVHRKTQEILGCHIIGPDASTLIHEVVVALKADRKRALEILRTAVHVHPALSEVVQRAALNVPV
ncbi:dihydrolipoyl dehydrogenase [Candidatus Woesearchaeota archaeon]|nr:dihydrolipoyl dehydrogenase [Candidatus Woesearchaeota archaeon]